MNSKGNGNDVFRTFLDMFVGRKMTLIILHEYLDPQPKTHFVLSSDANMTAALVSSFDETSLKTSFITSFPITSGKTIWYMVFRELHLAGRSNEDGP
jgi:hypothetical protein